MKTNSQKAAEFRNAKNSGKTSYNQLRTSEKAKKWRLENTIGFDTFGTDINTLTESVKNAYNGWQTQETMKNTQETIRSMQPRLSAYKEYQSMFGGADVGDLPDVYSQALKDWDSLTTLYGKYNNAGQYSQEQNILKKLDSMSSKDIEALKNREQNPIAYTTVDGREITWEDLYTNNKHRELINSPEAIKGWEKYGADKKAAEEAYNNRPWYVKLAETLGNTPDTTMPMSGTAQIIEDKASDNSWREPNDDWTEDEEKIFGAYYWEDPEKAYEYGAKLNNAKNLEKEAQQREDIASAATQDGWSMFGHTLGAIVTSPFGLADFYDDLTNNIAGRDVVADGFMSPFEYSQAVKGGVSSHINDTLGTLHEDIPVIGGKGWGDVYGLGVGVAESATSAYTLGGIGTAISYFGQGAAAGVDDALSRGATHDQALQYGLVLGAAEAVSEYIGADKLLKVGTSDIIKNAFKTVLKQAGAEGLEEGFSSLVGTIADNFIMQDKSNFNAAVQKYVDSGMSLEDAQTKAWIDSVEGIAYDALAGAASGGTHVAVKVPGAKLTQNAMDNNLGANIRNNERMDELFNTAHLTPRESEAYNLYTDYAVRNNRENISNKQLGRLYNSINSYAQNTLDSEETTMQQKTDAAIIKQNLAEIMTDNVELKQKKAKENRVAELTKGKEPTVTSKITGIKFGDDEKIITSDGEVSLDDVALSQKDAELVHYAEGIKGEYGADAANLFVEQYDGNADVDAYANSFNLAWLKGLKNLNEDSIIETRGVLDSKQVSAIYTATVKANAEAQKKAVNTITEKQGKNNFVQGNFDDSVIDYDSKTTDGNKVNWNSLTSTQKRAIKFAQLFAKATGVNIRFFKSKVVNGKHKGENGSYDPKSNTISIDVYAGRIDAKHLNDSIIPTLSHEITHWAKAKASVIYDALRNKVLETLKKDGSLTSDDRIAKEIARLDAQHPGKKHTEEDAIDELVARACEDMLKNSNAARKLLAKMSATEQQTFIDKVKETFENLIQWINDLLKQYNSDSEEAKILREFKADLKRISKQWDAMLLSAMEANQALQKEGIIAEELINGISKDGTTIVGKNNIQMSERTYENGGREFLENWLSEQEGLTDEDKADILRQTDMIKSLMEDIRKNNELPDYANWASMDVVKDENGEKVLSVIVKNGDYAMNIDFSQVCKKRVALNAVLNAMVQSGDLNAYTLTETDVADLNAIIKEHEFEIACALCFVDSKRYRVGSWAESFCEGVDKKKGKSMVHQYGFNEMVRSLIPKDSNIQVDEFNFTNREIVGQPTSNLLSEMDDSRLDFTLIDEILEREFKAGSKPTDLYAYAKAIKDNKNLRKILNPAEIVSSIGLDAIRLENKELYSLINRHQGTARPKFAHDVVAYTNDILKANNFTKEKAKMVGGVRCQSFSDFMANMVFDYVQFISELSAKELTAHSYTKEPLFVKLFGMTGMKINMSLVPKAVQMTPKQQKYFAILNDPNANKRSPEFKKAQMDYEKLAENAGLDDNGNYIWEDETFPYDIAMELVVDPRYSANCGTIAVGISDNHILKLLNDDKISMVIPYHKSGLNHIVAMMRNIDLYNDYTKIQGTRFANGVKLKNVPDFDFYGDLYGKDGKEGTHDPKKTTENYLKWCDEHNYIPKFEKSVLGRKFRNNPNYYKLLIDFRVYDTDGTYREQQPVKPIYPEKEEFRDLLLNGVVDKNGKVYGGLKQQQETSDKLDAESKQIVDEFKNKLKEKYGKDVLAVKYADRNIDLTDNDLTEYMQTGKQLHTRNKKQRMLEAGKKPILTSSVETKNFISDVIHGKAQGEVRAFKKVGKRLADAIQSKRNSLDLLYRYLELNADDLREAYKRHSSPKEKGDIPLTEQDFEMIPEYLDEFDGVLSVNTYNNKVEVHLYKETEDGYMRILTVVSNERNSLQVSKLMGVSKEKFEKQYAKKIERITGSPRGLNKDSNPSTTARLTASVLSNDSIAPLEEKVKTFTDRDYSITDNRAAFTEKHINDLYDDYSVSSTSETFKDYAQAYVAYINPTDFLSLTSLNGERIRSEAVELDLEKLQAKDDRELPYLEIDEETGEVYEHDGRHRLVAFENAGIEQVAIRLLPISQENKYHRKKTEITLKGQEFNWRNEKGEVVSSKANGKVTITAYPLSPSCRPEIEELFGTGKMQYSDRIENPAYDLMGENKRLEAENAKIKADIERLRERLKIERQVTHGNHFNKNQLEAVAGHIRKISKSTYSKPELVKLLNEVYSYIAQPEELNWDDLYAQCCDIARIVLEESKEETETNDYYKEILDEIRSARFFVNEGQKGNAKARFGNKWHQSFFGKTNVTDNATTSLYQKWKEWSEAYPDIFDASISDADQLVELYDIYDDVREGSVVVKEYDEAETIRWLAKEIYNQYWNVSTIKTTADKYDKQIKRLNFEHRKAMQEFRNDYEERLAEQKKTERERAKELVAKIRERKDREVAEAKQLGKERLDKYKENAERKTKIQSITSNALTLNKWLVKNSKDEHIHESLKGPVIALLQAIDFSSKRMLDEKTPTQKDISLAKALGKVKDMMVDATAGKEELVELYGHDMDKDIAKLVDFVYDIKDSFGDNEFILNKMSLESLQTLDKTVKIIKSAVTKMNQFHIVQHKQGVANLSQEGIEYLEKLGEQVEHGGWRGKLDKKLKWENVVPYYAFKRLGDVGKKIFAALQDGWDKLAFNSKKITDFTNATYTSKEVRGWGEESKTFTITQANGKKRTFEMSIAQIMALHCVSKQADAMKHLLSGGMTLARFEKKGQVIKEKENILLTPNDIAMITGALTNRQREVADKLQEFMNTVCADWGNEVSMQRFATKMFTTPDYFPIKVSPSTITNEDPKDIKEVSLFRLLNMSFTKARNEFANQSIEIANIFDVFAQHTSDMAKYNALALPVLDAYRWYSFKGKTNIGEEYSTRASLDIALGKDSEDYFRVFLKDLNGSQNVARDTLDSWFFRNSKIAAVAANLRTILLQPTSYLRARDVIKNRYLVKAFLHKPKIAKSKQYCGMAQWKAQGYYDVNISKGLTEKIKHDETWKDKVIEYSMKGMEIADQVTLGYLWNACELEIRETRKDLQVGSEEFYMAIGKRLRDVIYATQVVDSTMTRSHIMRSSDRKDKELTAFLSEPTLAYNMLMDIAFTSSLDTRQYGAKESFKRNGKRIANGITTYVLVNAVCALIESGFDVFRDDDDEEMGFEEFMKLYLKNFAQDLSIIGKIPYLKEILSALNGYSASRSDTQWMYSLVNAGKAWGKILSGEGEGQGNKMVKNTLRTFSDLSGLAFYRAYVDMMAALNKLDILSAEELEEFWDELFGN